MANRWNRYGPYSGGGGGYMGSAGLGFYMGGPPSVDRRMYTTPPKPAYGGYRESNFGRRPERRDDVMKRGPPKDKSPVAKRHHETPPQRRDKPFGRRPHTGRYEVKVPKTMFNVKKRSFIELRHHYPRLVVAPDFYECESPWCDTFPVHAPFQIGHGTDYHVFHRDVDAPTEADTSLLNPPDADYSYSARVMLMACPQLAELYKNTCRMSDDQPGVDKLPILKNMHFLVGGRAKSETMAVGGPWSPSMDGTDPTDPMTLIKTAIRTMKGYTGLDLSSCTEWIRFMEIKYYRFANGKAPSFTGEEEDRIIDSERPEVVVFFIPIASHLIPSEEEWAKTREHYSAILEKMLSEKQDDKKDTEKTETSVIQNDTSTIDVSMDEPEEACPPADAEATHYSKLDLNSLKVNELRNELAARNLDTKGLKVNLVSRLQAALDDEKKKDTEGDMKPEDSTAEETPAKPTSPTPQTKDDASKELSEKDRRRLERIYRLNEKPVIVIHPNKSAKGGRFDCHRVSLFSLLDYRTNEQKEHNFEVSLFAEQFNEMLQRDCAFTIFKAINDAPEKESKSEQDEKLENGIDHTDEPEAKRRRNDDKAPGDEGDEHKVRHIRRTVRPDLLFAFTFFDTGRAGFMQGHDLAEILHFLGMRYSRLQMRRIISKVVTRRGDHIEYHQLTDSDIVQGDDKDVVNIKPSIVEDTEVMKMLALGNRALFDIEQPPVPARICIGGANAEGLNARMEKAEKQKREMEYQFFQIKDELEKTRVQTNSFKDTEDALRAEKDDLSSRLKTEQKQAREHRSLSSNYHSILVNAKDRMDRSLSEINKQFDREKAEKEAELEKIKKAEGKTEESASKDDAKTGEDKEEEEEEEEEKEWHVVDAV